MMKRNSIATDITYKVWWSRR